MRSDSGAVRDRGPITRLLAVLERVAGMPDYPGYVAHMAERHPDRAVLSEREFFESYLTSRYGSGVSRCC